MLWNDTKDGDFSGVNAGQYLYLLLPVIPQVGLRRSTPSQVPQHFMGGEG